MTVQLQDTAPTTVWELCDRIAAANDLSVRRRTEISGDLRRACVLIPDLAPSRADGRVCTPKLSALTVVKTGLTIKRIQNIRASIKAAFRWNAKMFPKGSGRPQLGPEWTCFFKTLQGDVESQRPTSAASRIPARGSASCLCRSTMPRSGKYLEYSVRVELLTDSRQAQRLIARHWAKAIQASPELGLQALTAPAPPKARYQTEDRRVLICIQGGLRELQRPHEAAVAS